MRSEQNFEEELHRFSHPYTGEPLWLTSKQLLTATIFKRNGLEGTFMDGRTKEEAFEEWLKVRTLKNGVATTEQLEAPYPPAPLDELAEKELADKLQAEMELQAQWKEILDEVNQIGFGLVKEIGGKVAVMQLRYQLGQSGYQPDGLNSKVETALEVFQMLHLVAAERWEVALKKWHEGKYNKPSNRVVFYQLAEEAKRRVYADQPGKAFSIPNTEEAKEAHREAWSIRLIEDWNGSRSKTRHISGSGDESADWSSMTTNGKFARCLKDLSVTTDGSSWSHEGIAGDYGSDRFDSDVHVAREIDEGAIKAQLKKLLGEKNSKVTKAVLEHLVDVFDGKADEISDQEIAEKIGRSKSGVNKAKRELRERLKGWME